MMDWSHPFRNGSPSTALLNTKRFGDIDVSPADRSPCPVCGHPTGDCAGQSDVLPDTKLPVNMYGSEPMILVEKDVTEERQITPYTKTRVLIHRVGDYVPLSRARELGLVK